VAIVAEVGGEVEGAGVEGAGAGAGAALGDGCWEGGEACSRGRGPGEREDGGEVRVHGVQSARGQDGARALRRAAAGGRGGAVVGCGAAVGWGRALGGRGRARGVRTRLGGAEDHGVGGEVAAVGAFGMAWAGRVERGGLGLAGECC